MYLSQLFSPERRPAGRMFGEPDNDMLRPDFGDNDFESNPFPQFPGQGGPVFPGQGGRPGPPGGGGGMISFLFKLF